MRILSSVPVLLLSVGCEEYYTPDTACFETLPGATGLPPASQEALARVNCYRRLTGVLKASGNATVQIAANAAVDYVAQNPDPEKLIGFDGPVVWLDQVLDNPGFTGVNIYERLYGTGPGQAGYVALDPVGTETWEFIRIELAERVEDLPSGAAAVDHFMRDPEFRQTVLQPSWVDGAYAELELPENWYSAQVQSSTAGGGLSIVTSNTLRAKAYYFLTLYSAPHTEHVDRPVILPKEDQVDVPLYAWSENQNVPDDAGGFAPVQVSYPITLLMGALDPTNYSAIDANQYQAQFTNAAIQAEDGTFLEVEAVHPADPAEDVYPTGRFLRTTLALYAEEPFLPATRYTVFAEYSSPEGQFELEYSFRTTSEDPGVDPDIGRVLSTIDAGATRRARTLYQYAQRTPASAVP